MLRMLAWLPRHSNDVAQDVAVLHSGRVHRFETLADVLFIAGWAHD